MSKRRKPTPAAPGADVDPAELGADFEPLALDLSGLEELTAQLQLELDALDMGALEAEAEAILHDLLHPEACPWCGRPFDDNEVDPCTETQP